MSRQFDNRQSFLDNEGNPLIGRISFYKFGTTEYEDIETADGTPLPNPIFTNTIGQSVNQVFLKDNKDYTVYFEKYIGQGVFTDDPLIDNWEFQYSCINLYDTFAVTLNGNSVVSVDNIEDLKDFNPEMLGDRNLIQVLGYNEIGDCEPVFYKWDSSSVENTNGGSIIGSDVIPGQGRWKLVDTFSETFDVRHFGVFGAITRNLAPDSMGAQITAAQTYANSIGKKLYFPAIENDISWYNVKTVQSISNGKFDTNVYLFDDSNGTHYITCTNDGVNLYGAAHYILMSDTIRTSWGSEATNVEFRPASVLLFDATTSTSYKSITGVVIRGSYLISGWAFNNCIFEVNKLLYTDNTFNNCKLEGKFFANDAYIAGMCTDCYADISDFKNRVDLYVQYRLTSDTNPNIDFGGVQSNVNPLINYSANVVESDVIRISNFNATSEVKPAKIQNSILEIHNCTGSYNLSNYGYADTIIIKGCKDIAITNTANGGVSLIIEDSSVIMPTKSVESLSVRNSTIVSGKITCNNFTSYSSILSTAINCKNIVVKDSQINSSIAQTINGVCTTFVDNNIFNAQLSISGASGSQVVNAVITNNFGSIVTPIQINRTYLDSVDSHHNYTYEGNKGTFMKRSAKFSQDITLISDIQNFTGSQWFWTLAEGDQGFKMPYIALPSYYYDDGTAYYRHHFKFSSQVSVFRIGTDDLEINVDWVFNGLNSSVSVGYITPNKFKAKLVHTNGESYRVESLWIGEEPTQALNGQVYITSYFNAASSIQSLGSPTLNGTFSFSIE